ncbi:MAG: cell division protein SepF [Clostridium sp.]|nr:cell division protein SepF [Clostridium sp.]
MAKVLNKVMGILGLDDGSMEDYEEENLEKDEEFEDEIQEPIAKKKSSSKVVNIHANSKMRVVILQPKDFDEATSICSEFREGKVVVVNISNLEQKIARRLLDFMSGASYVLDGQFQKVEENVYILFPSNVDLTNDIKTDISSKSLFTWQK